MPLDGYASIYSPKPSHSVGERIYKYVHQFGIFSLNHVCLTPLFVIRMFSPSASLNIPLSTLPPYLSSHAASLNQSHPPLGQAKGCWFQPVVALCKCGLRQKIRECIKKTRNRPHLRLYFERQLSLEQGGLIPFVMRTPEKLY
ncbi:unnamed protein product [Protopolystoma xenopodis]|uniref:Uncharacterized protein n=1 Tax=Protopolystoma xenopodis TaxID=117903 RepID=A0A3S5CFP3_9PLAT|nr:unnamed protein product [Protopolystoma xenopodis]